MPNCKQCNIGFEISGEDKKFLKEIAVPEPTLCPVCRRQRRLAFWPYGILQKRKCDFSGESIISTYPPSARFPVYKRNHWFSDDWDPPEMDIEWDRSFFDQFYELQSKTPHFHQLGKNNVNCDYADDVWSSKNAYLSRAMLEAEDVYYVYRLLYSRNCMDCTYCYYLEQCYECTYCFKGYNLKFCLDCRDCSDSAFLYNCRGCRNCFMCWNLNNKTYCIFNKQYSREDYEEKINSLRLDSRKFLDELRVRFKEHVKKDAVHRADYNINSQNCTGNYISNSKNCHDVYFLEYGEDSRHMLRAPYAKNCVDNSGLLTSEKCYETSQCTDLNNVYFAIFAVDCYDSQYIDQCFNCNDIFGCVGLKRKKYCILNKQYTKEEYKKLVLKLIGKMKQDGEYGEFFPYKFAYNGFNLSLGAFYYNETEGSMRHKNGLWEPEKTEDIKEGIKADALPDSSADFSDEIIGRPICCFKTGRLYSFIKQELDFYPFHKLPLPVLSPEERNKERFSQFPPLDPRKTKCTHCRKEITVYYPKSWGYEKIYCETCYLKEVY